MNKETKIAMKIKTKIVDVIFGLIKLIIFVGMTSLTILMCMIDYKMNGNDYCPTNSVNIMRSHNGNIICCDSNSSKLYIVDGEKIDTIQMVKNKK